MHTRGRDWWRGKLADRALAVAGFLLPIVTWIREREVGQRLADVEIPRGYPLSMLLFALIGQRRRDRAFSQFGGNIAELGTALATRMRETDQRQQELLDLQASLEQLAKQGDERERQMIRLQERLEYYTKWLVVLTVVLGVIGIATIATTV